ncbi:MAG: HNH endonuclease signature motif containing protein, partial [Elainellaceae cyanobacterium]
MGTAVLLGRKLSNNDKSFFKKFAVIREQLEKNLINHKDLIATILQKHTSKKRVEQYHKILEGMINKLISGEEINDESLIEISGLKGKLVVGGSQGKSKGFSPEVKSEAFINTALISAMRCSICNGYLDPDKSISYDHIKRKREDGDGGIENCQLTHPYC